VCTKDLYICVGMIYYPRGLSGVSTAGLSVEGVLHLEMLGCWYEAPMGPFYSPKGPRSCHNIHMEAQKLPCMLAHWTGLVHHRTEFVRPQSGLILTGTGLGLCTTGLIDDISYPLRLKEPLNKWSGGTPDHEH
jgi:hypothetical protein